MNITANITQSLCSIGIPSTLLILPATFLMYLRTCPQHFTSAANQQHHILVPRNNPITSPQMRPLYHLPQSIPTAHFIGAMKYKYTLNITPPSIHVSSPCPTFPAGASQDVPLGADALLAAAHARRLLPRPPLRRRGQLPTESCTCTVCLCEEGLQHKVKVRVYTPIPCIPH